MERVHDVPVRQAMRGLDVVNEAVGAYWVDEAAIKVDTIERCGRPRKNAPTKVERDGGESSAVSVTERAYVSIIGMTPNAIAVDDRVGRVFVASIGRLDARGNPMGNGVLSILDAVSGQALATVAVGRLPRQVAVDDRTHQVLVACEQSKEVTLIDGLRGSVIRRISLPGPGSEVTVDPVTGRGFVTSFATGQTTVIEMRTGRTLYTIKDGGC